MAYKVGRCLLRYRLNDAQMNQEELSAKLGVTSQQVNKYVRNRQKMSLQVAKNIASILDCQIEDLYEWIEAGDNE
ncbi:helix-turn-helix transcriptional regulator [Virgibacillus salexigens]|uniref:helix-turn-helix transcriptional regulator n=1 Tax=Virgibacillus TaxID=84406 RepID=UPI00136E84AF|nr:helix-turn-helix transcriptional regulator [Virgibacillus massiliensis]MYL41785.1 helix-turn-helix domain-containing protein [Virgibacillus massiliensis]